MPHRAGEAPGIRVLAARMVGAEQDRAFRQPGLRAVPEGRPIPRAEPVPESARAQPALVRDSAQRHHHAHALAQQAPFRGEIGPAIVELLPRRLVVGRRASRRGADQAAFELQAVARPKRGGLGGEAEAVERLVEPVSARVAGEHAARAVAAVRRRGQADHEQAGARVAEDRHRAAPVRLVEEGAALHAGDLGAVGAETRAALAGDHAPLDREERPEIREHIGPRRLPRSLDTPPLLSYETPPCRSADARRAAYPIIRAAIGRPLCTQSISAGAMPW